MRLVILNVLSNSLQNQILYKLLYYPPLGLFFPVFSLIKSQSEKFKSANNLRTFQIILHTIIQYMCHLTWHWECNPESIRPNWVSLPINASCSERNCITYLVGHIQEAPCKLLTSGKRPFVYLTSFILCNFTTYKILQLLVYCGFLF